MVLFVIVSQLYLILDNQETIDNNYWSKGVNCKFADFYSAVYFSCIEVILPFPLCVEFCYP